MNPMVGRFPICIHGYMTPCPEGCGTIQPTEPIPGLPPLADLTLDVIEAHLRSLGLRSRVSWRGGEWTVTLTSRKEEHQKTPSGKRSFGRSKLIEEAFARALEAWEKNL